MKFTLSGGRLMLPNKQVNCSKSCYYCHSKRNRCVETAISDSLVFLRCENLADNQLIRRAGVENFNILVVYLQDL